MTTSSPEILSFEVASVSKDKTPGSLSRSPKEKPFILTPSIDDGSSEEENDKKDDKHDGELSRL